MVRSTRKLKYVPIIFVITGVVAVMAVPPVNQHVVAIAGIRVNSSPISILVNPQTNKLYVSYEFSDKVSVIDTNTDHLIATIKVERGAHVLALDSIRNEIYVTNEGSGDVSIIDGDTDTLMQTFKVGGRPAGISVEAVEGSTPSAYITNEIQDMPVRNVDIYNNNTKNICLVSPCMIGSLTAAPENPFYVGAQRGIDVNSLTGVIYVANPDKSNVFVISDTSVKRPIHVGGCGPADVAVDPTTNLVYVTDLCSNALSVINGTTTWHAYISIASTNTSFIPDADAPPRIAVSPVTHMIYATDPTANLVYWINTTAYRTNPQRLSSVFQALPVGININKLSSFGLNAGPPIHVGKYPTGIAVDNITGLVYVTNTYSGTVSLINGKTNKLVVGVNFNIQPSGSGDIDCTGGKTFSTAEYARIDNGTRCHAERNGGFIFKSWSGDLVSDPMNRSIPTFSPSGYGTLTANFVSPPPLISPDQLNFLITTVIAGVIAGPIVGAVIGWMLPPRRP
jgi:YVTN family beta-propeller protein